MHIIRLLLFSVCTLSATSMVMAETVERSLMIRLESEIFATRGETVLTQADFDARLDRIPEDHRVPFLASPERIERAMKDEMLLRMLADDGMEAGLLDDERTQALLWQSAMHLIAERHVENVLEEAELDDYSQQARELWLVGDYRPENPEKFDFTHLLVSSVERTEARAARLAWQFYEQLEQGAAFGELIEAHSEDPSVEENRGRFTGVSAEELEPEFAAALSDLEQAGEIFEPVQTRYGWHIIRLDRRHPARSMKYEEALPELKEIARQRHRESVRDRYYASLFDQPGEIKEGAVRKLLERYGVDQVLADE